MRNCFDRDPTPLSPGHRFNNLWAQITTKQIDEFVNHPLAAGDIRGGTYTYPDGQEHTAIIRTMDLPSEGFKKPATREIDVILENGMVYTLNDMNVVGDPDIFVIDTIIHLEKILPTFR